MQKHSATKKLPFEILYSFNPPYSADSALETKVPMVAKQIQMIQEVQEEAVSSLWMAVQYAKDWDQNQDLPQWKEGTQVWLEGTHIRTTHLKFKLAPRQYGPFKILEKVGSLAYKLKTPKYWKIHLVFHATMLTKYKEMEAHGVNFIKPPLEVLNDEEHYEVEAILDSKHQE